MSFSLVDETRNWWTRILLQKLHKCYSSQETLSCAAPSHHEGTPQSHDSCHPVSCLQTAFTSGVERGRASFRYSLNDLQPYPAPSWLKNIIDTCWANHQLNFFFYSIFKLRQGASISRFVGWSVCLSVCQKKFTTLNWPFWANLRTLKLLRIMIGL